MESSSEFCDFRPCSPTFQRVLDETGTSLNDCSCKIAESMGPFSAVDAYNMQPSMFTSFHGAANPTLLPRVSDNLISG